MRRSPCGSRTTPSSRVAMRCSGSRRRRLSLSRPRPARNLALPSSDPCGWRGRAHRKHRLAPASSHVLGGSWGTGATSLPWGTTHPSLSLPRRQSERRSCPAFNETSSTTSTGGWSAIVVTAAQDSKCPLPDVNRVPRLPVGNRATERRRLGRLAVHRLQPEQKPCHPVLPP